MSKKISQLTAVSSANITGSEDLAIVQSSETKKTTLNDVQHYIVNHLDPTALTVSKDQTIDLGLSTYATSELIELSWSGSNGTMVLNLPLAASNVNRVMRFISNTGFGAGTQNADLTPQGGDTLDGSTNKYRINKAYEGIQVWSNGVEWFIIQKKA